MISLRSILAAENSMTDVNVSAQNLVTAVFIISGVLLALAFAVGFIKGFRKVSWGGLAWLVGGLAFVLVSRIVPTGAFWLPLLLAVICAGGSFALFRVLAFFLRPKMRWIKDDINADTSLAEYGLEFEPEYLDYDGEHESTPYGKRIYKTGYGTPCFFFRLLGGVTCVLNVSMILGALFSLFLLVVDVSVLKTYPIGGIFENETIQAAFPFVKNYALDFIMIGVMMAMARAGYHKGIVYTLLSMIMTVATLAVIGGGFYLPFSPWASTGALATLNETCIKIFAGIDIMNGTFGELLGKLLAGAALLVLFSVILVIVNILLKTFCKKLVAIKFTHKVDCWIAAAVYLAIGAMICVGIWFILAAIDAMGIFPFSAMIGENASLSKAIYDYIMSLIGPFFAGL